VRLKDYQLYNNEVTNQEIDNTKDVFLNVFVHFYL